MLKDTIDNSHLHFIRLLNKFYVFLLRVTPGHVYFELYLRSIGVTRHWDCLVLFMILAGPCLHWSGVMLAELTMFSSIKHRLI